MLLIHFSKSCFYCRSKCEKVLHNGRQMSCDTKSNKWRHAVLSLLQRFVSQNTKFLILIFLIPKIHKQLSSSKKVSYWYKPLTSRYIQECLLRCPSSYRVCSWASVVSFIRVYYIWDAKWRRIDRSTTISSVTTSNNILWLSIQYSCPLYSRDAWVTTDCTL